VNKKRRQTMVNWLWPWSHMHWW